MLQKPKRYDPYHFLNTDLEWFKEFKKQEIKRIENEERDPIELKGRNAHGQAVYLVDNEDYYLLSYEDINIAPIEMPIFEPRDLNEEGYHDFVISDYVWDMWQPCLVDPYEAMLLPSRWGTAARYIAWVLWVSPHGTISFHTDKGIGDSFDEFLMKNNEKYKEDNESRDPDIRAKGLRQTVQRLCNQGWIRVFVDDPNDQFWLVEQSELLMLNWSDLEAKHPDLFESHELDDYEEITGLIVDLGKPTKMWRAGDKHWRARDGAHFYAPVEAQGTNPRQPIEAVIRGTPTSTSSITPKFASFQQVSEIVTSLALQPYMADVKNQRIFEAMAEIRDQPVARDATQVKKCLAVFLPPDLIDIYNYVESRLDAKSRDFLEYSSKIKGVHGDALIILALTQLSTKDGTHRHVLRQIRLLTIALIQDLLGTMGGQFVDWSEEINEKTEA